MTKTKKPPASEVRRFEVVGPLPDLRLTPMRLGLLMFGLECLQASLSAKQAHALKVGDFLDELNGIATTHLEEGEEDGYDGTGVN